MRPAVFLGPQRRLDGIPDAYAAMNERRAIKALIRIDTKGTRR